MPSTSSGSTNNVVTSHRGEGDETTLDSFAGDTSFLLDTSAAAETKLHASPDNNPYTIKGILAKSTFRNKSLTKLLCSGLGVNT